MHGIEKELGRPVYGLAEYLFRALPVVGHDVVAHRRRARAPRQRVPAACTTTSSSRSCSRKVPRAPASSSSDRYKLHRFGRGGFVEIAMRSGAPIIPIAVVGAEESMPILFKSRRLAALLNIPYFPITANMLAFGPAGMGIYFPAKFRLRVLPPIHFDVQPDQERYPRALVMEEAEQDPRDHPGSPLRHAAHPPQRVVRLRRRHGRHAHPRHRARHLLGQPARAGARADRRRRDDRRARHARAPPPARAHRVRAGRLELLDPRPHRAGHEGRHDPAHAPDRRLDRDLGPRAARDQRDRHDEPAGRGRRGRELRCARSS